MVLARSAEPITRSTSTHGQQHSADPCMTFGDTGRRRILGVADVQGSAGGFLSSNVANTAPSVFTNMHAMGDVDGIVVLTSTPADSTDPTVASHTFNAIVSDIALSSTMGGDATGTFNFQLAGGTDTQGVATGGTAMEAWDESV